MRNLTFVLMATLSASGCQWGMRPAKYPPAQNPSGAIVAVRVAGEPADRVGELYGVDSIGVTIHAERLTRIAWKRLYALDVDKLGRSVDVHPQEIITLEKRKRLAAVSRFPQGLSEDLLREVLTRLGQQSVEEVARGNLDSLARIASVASLRYRDRTVAIEDGYRRIGGDFPGMGEHWVHPLRIQTREHVDASRPSFLTYATISGESKLLGTGFVVTSDTTSTGAPPGWPEQWHEHSGLIGDESAGAAGMRSRNGGTHVFVLHIWTTLENPDGTYAPDNWALPFARVGLVAPLDVEADAGRAFSLTVGGDEFLIGALSDLGLRKSEKTNSVVAAARDRALKVADRLRSSVTAADGAELRLIWADLGASLEALIGPEVIPVMQPAHPVTRHSPSHSHATPR